jgi:hypothetical protein
MPTEKVEIGFDLTATGGPFLTLDDPVAGKLDDPEWVLAGTIFYDITGDVRNISINRGKSNFIDNISAGEVVVELNNRNRDYDPTYAAGPYYGQIIPKRAVRVSSNDIIEFSGLVDDWNLLYEPNGEAIATFVASDGFVYLNNQTLNVGTATVEYSGARVNAILDDPTVLWPTELRDIDTGVHQLGADVITDNTNALTYLRLVEQSEGGRLFISKNGYVTFRDQSVTVGTGTIVELSDNGTGIPYQNMVVVYGSEQLYNEVVLESAITNTQVLATDSDSISQYGIFNLTQTGLLTNSDTQLAEYASTLVKRFSEPEYRFDSVQVRLNDLSLANQNAVLDLEIGNVVKITFTPSSIPPAIEKYAEIIRINHEVDITGEHLVTFGFATVDYVGWLLGTEAFGRLDFVTTI